MQPVKDSSTCTQHEVWVGGYSGRITSSPAGKPAVTERSYEESSVSLNLSYFYSLLNPHLWIINPDITPGSRNTKLVSTDN